MTAPRATRSFFRQGQHSCGSMWPIANHLRIAALDEGLCPNAAFQVAACAEPRHFVRHDLIAQDQVVDDVGFPHGLANELAGAERGNAKQQQDAAKPGERIQPGLLYGPRNSSTKTAAVTAKIRAMSTLSTPAA